jgi:hypothetical protein
MRPSFPERFSDAPIVGICYEVGQGQRPRRRLSIAP